MTNHEIDATRVLTKVQQDPMGQLLVQNALQQCVIEDQTETIRGLQEELVEKSAT